MVLTPVPGAGRCAVPGCECKAQPNQLMCRRDWYRVTEATRSQVIRAFRHYRLGLASLGELREAQQRAIREAEA